MVHDDEKSYECGSRAAWEQLLGLAIKNLGLGGNATAQAVLLAEREAAVVALRGLCGSVGASNEWGAELHLADVIDKHLGNHLRATRGGRGDKPPLTGLISENIALKLANDELRAASKQNARRLSSLVPKAIAALDDGLDIGTTEEKLEAVSLLLEIQERFPDAAAESG